MIITQTPLRISLAGGGTDFPEFFLQHGGAVLSMAIDKYVYVIAKERFDDQIYINYSRKEIVDSVEEIKHDLIREAMRKTGLTRGVEITTLADVPSEGSGLGSSSSITVGLLNCFYAYKGIQVAAEQLAKEAAEIEIDILGRPIGIQDHYIAAYGNLHVFEFQRGGDVRVERLEVSEAVKRRLASNLLLFYTGRTRNSYEILAEQQGNIKERVEELCQIRDMAFEARGYLCSHSLDDIGRLLARAWEQKKRLATRITAPLIDELYERAIAAGALGGKLAGAGGGGFLVLYCPSERHGQVRAALPGLRELPFLPERYGSKVIFNISRYEWK